MRFFSPERLSLDAGELARRLGAVPDEKTAVLVAEYRDKLLSEVQCGYVFRESRVEASGSVCRFDFGEVTSRNLGTYLAGAERVYLFAATIGHGADRVIRAAGSLGAYRQFVADAVASVLIEVLCNAAQRELPLATVSRFSPGYGDCPIALQRPLLDTLEAERRLGIRLSPSMLMTPTKSVRALIRIKGEKS